MLALRRILRRSTFAVLLALLVGSSGCTLLMQSSEVRKAVENELSRDVNKVEVASSTETGKTITVYMAQSFDDGAKAEIEGVVRKTVPDTKHVRVVDGSSRANHAGDSRPNHGGSSSGDTRPNNSGDTRPNGGDSRSGVSSSGQMKSTTPTSSGENNGDTRPNGNTRPNGDGTRPNNYGPQPNR